jgi:drug/metabolite transporter (DMT)-like permease
LKQLGAAGQDRYARDMWLFLLTCLTMCAFAANSLLTRYAIDQGFADPGSFAILRVLSGALVLTFILIAKGVPLRFAARDRWIGALSLSVYMIGFSAAYVSLDAGLGALVLFGVVQIAMFLHAARTGSSPNSFQVTGALIAFAGLTLVLWPGAMAATDVFGAAAMVCAGLGWAAYTIAGRRAKDPLEATAVSFVQCLPVLLVVLLPFVSYTTLSGLFLAVVCGGLTSGLGYALWYSVLPGLTPALAATVQLSVPVLAILGGAFFLQEALTATTIVSAVMVLAGIALATRKRSAPAGRS